MHLCSGVYISHIILVFRLLTLSRSLLTDNIGNNALMQTQLINTRGCKICSKLANLNTCLSGGLIINFENIRRLVLVFLLLTYKHFQI